jgi:hypothetical protein
MSHVSDLQLEDLPDVKPYLINKLKRDGIESVLDLAVSIPYELAERGGGGDYYYGAENNTAAVTADIDTISQLAEVI